MISNYLDKTFCQGVNQCTKRQMPQYIMTYYDRSYAIQKIFELHRKKEYKMETLFTAAQIFDRYLYTLGFECFPRDHMTQLATVCMLMAAKLEQPISPSFSRMIYLLHDDERMYISKEALIKLEAQILVTLGFDFNFPGPMQSLERYLRILDYDSNRTVNEMSFQICKYQLNEAQFLNYRPSQIAACALVIAINIFERDQLRYNNRQALEFFKGADLNKPLKLNTAIWNNPTVLKLTGYSIQMLARPMYELSVFITKNLTPNKLEGFDIHALLYLKNFNAVE